MGRFEGQSPFQGVGLVYVGGAGQLLVAGQPARRFQSKPLLSFEFDALYCEQTLCHRVEADEDHALDASQIAEVDALIVAMLTEPVIVNGVDSTGKYFASVPIESVTRVVQTTPPPSGTWRLNMDVSPTEMWVGAHCVDGEGAYLGNVDEGAWDALATTAPPASVDGEDWRWSGIQWVDARPELERLTAARDVRIAAAWTEHVSRFSAHIVMVNVGGEMRPYGCDRTTHENILAINSGIARAPGLIPNPRPFTPKGGGAEIDHTHDDFLAIYLAGLTAGDVFYVAYKAHKDAITALTDVEAIRAYDVTTGWPT